MREMGQSAWLSTLTLTLQGSEGRVNARKTEGACNDRISWSNNYSVWRVIGKGEPHLGGYESGSRFIPLHAVIFRQGCYRLASTLAMGSLPG